MQKPSLADFALQLVLQNGETYALHPDAPRVLEAALDDLFTDGTLDPIEEIVALLRVGGLFESKYAAFEIADAIFEAIAQDDRALAALGIRRGGEAQRRFSRTTGEGAGAPAFGEAPPAGSLRVSATGRHLCSPSAGRSAPKSGSRRRIRIER